MSGTGFMKCIPITRSARLVAAPIFVMEIDEVLVARIVLGDVSRSSSRNSSSLTSRLSIAASTKRPSPAHASS
jgi:hypothetical protein